MAESKMPASLTSLIERIEAATEGSRELDLAVHLALFPNGEIAGWMKYPRGLSGREGYSWDISGSALIFEKRTADGRCPYNGGVTLPHVSTSIDAALTLLPEGFKWKCGYSRHVPHNAEVIDYSAHTGTFIGESDASRCLALLAAILRARQAAQSGQAQTEARG